MSHILKHSDSLVKIRLITYFAMLGHLIYICTTLLDYDFENCKDLEMRRYKTHKWRLITAWLNVSSSFTHILKCFPCYLRKLLRKI